MNRNTLLGALALPLALAACSGQRSGAEEAVRDALKDPDSAKFGEFYFNSKTGRGCLTTNAKNSMGGYTGDSQSHLRRDKEGWHYVSDSEETPGDCRAGYADKARSEEQLLDEAADRMHAAADAAEANKQ